MQNYEIANISKTPFVNRSNLDRFINQRSSIADIKTRNSMARFDNDMDLNRWCTKDWNRKRYMLSLNQAFGIDHKPPPRRSSPEKHDEVKPWPCFKRDRRYMASTDNVLDLPKYSSAYFPEILDWNRDNVLVAALGSSYYKWNWKTQTLSDGGTTSNPVYCCKFDPLGHLLALGTTSKFVELHDHVKNKMVWFDYCRCSTEGCSITAIDWSPTGKAFIIGCTKGMLNAFTRDAFLIKNQVAFSGPIMCLRISPNARYVAVTGVVPSQSVLIFLWPSLEKLLLLRFSWAVQAITWHPLCSALLAIGTLHYGHRTGLTLWDASSTEFPQKTVSSSNDYLDTMLFSEVTGELLLSLWDTESSKESRLVVLSDPNTVVDQWGGEERTYLERIRTMVFSPDGTKLATATLDEELIILKFLPDKYKKDCKKNNKFTLLPVQLDVAEQGFSFR